MHGYGTATTAMLGLPGFRVLAVSEHDGEVEQAVETLAGQGWCRSCGVRAKLHDRRPSWVRDPAAGGGTERARREACRRVGEDGHTVASVAAGFGVGWAP